MSHTSRIISLGALAASQQGGSVHSSSRLFSLNLGTEVFDTLEPGFYPQALEDNDEY